MFFIIGLSAYLWLCVLFGMPLGFTTVSGSSSVEYCPVPTGFRGIQNISNMYPTCSNDSSVSLIEQIQCQFNWTNRAEMIEKVNDRIKHRHKQFLRFYVPVFYVDRASGSWKEVHKEFETWVWVAATHEYMLYFPHNFNVLSLGTMGIITNNFWKPDGEGDIYGSCDDHCVNSKMATHRCALTRDDMLNFMTDVAIKDKIEWNYVCRQLNYDVTDVIHNPNSAIPDLFYYSRFLWQLFTRRPYLGIAISRDDFIHYNCFEKNGHLEKKELLMHYNVICLLAVVLWSFSPLLIYYFPSSKPTFSIFPSGLDPKDFHPTYKSPVYFVSFLRCIFCFYMKENVAAKSRLRRLLFLLCSFVITIRFFYTPYWSLLVVHIFVFLVVSLPEFWSVYLHDNQPTHFLDLWEYPKGVFGKNTREKEYQFLAHCMKERVFLVLDLELWKMLCFKSFKSALLSNAWLQLYADFPISIVKLVSSFFVCAIALVTVLLATLVYHFIPAFYFYKKIFLAIHEAMRHSLLRNSSSCVNALMSIISFVCSVILVGYFMVFMMFCCYLFADVTMFTYIGTVLDPSMAFKYVSLVGAISLLLHKFATDLRETYDDLRDQIVDILKTPDHRSQLCNNGEKIESNGPKVELDGQKVESDGQKVIESDGQIVESDDGLKILLKINSQAPQVLLYRDHFATYLSRPLLDLCIEQCNPIRRQVSLIVVKVLLITFYVSIAMWIKNVFHKEKEVSSIFVVARDIAMYFVPNLIQFLSDKRRKGKKDSGVFLHRRVHEAIAAYIKKQQALVSASSTVRP